MWKITHTAVRLCGALVLAAVVSHADASTVYKWTGNCEFTPPDPTERILYCPAGLPATMRVVLSDEYVPGTTVTGTGTPPSQVLSWTLTFFATTYDVLRNQPPFLNLGFISLTLPVDAGPGNAFLQGPTSGTIDATGWNLMVTVIVGADWCCVAGHGSIGRWERVIPVATLTSITSSRNPSTLGQAATLTATVSGSSPTGLVQFFDGASSLGTVALGAGSIATLTTPALTQGTHTITAVYSGDDNNRTSTSLGVQQSVNAVVIPSRGPVQAIPVMGEAALMLLGALVAMTGIAGIRHYRR